MRLLRYIPKNYLSWVIGKLAEKRLPPRFNQRLLSWYCARYRVNLDEAEFPPESYSSLSRFFQRNLKPGRRPVGGALVCPVDGALMQFGRIEDGTLIQAKGKTYTLSKLLADDTLAQVFNDGFYLTYYLAPGDYHHIHSPVDGKIVESIHAEGKLWPVNSWSVEHISDLFTVNERITTVIDSSIGKCAVVKVGATNVGSISTAYNTFVGNRSPGLFSKRSAVHRETFQPGIPISRGERLGSFRMGSTVILAFEHAGLIRQELLSSGPVRYGQEIAIAEQREQLA